MTTRTKRNVSEDDDVVHEVYLNLFSFLSAAVRFMCVCACARRS